MDGESPTLEKIKARMARMRSLIQPDYDCIVMTDEIFKRIKAEVPLTAEPARGFKTCFGLPFYAEPDEYMAKARAILLNSEGKRVLVVV